MPSALSKINSRAPLDRSPKKNWVENSGGLPMYIRRIANHLHQEKGMTIGHAIAVAVNAVKKSCATGDLNWKGKQNVNAKSRAEACAAVASWERKKAQARVSKGLLGRKWTDDEFIAFLTGEGEIHKSFDCGCGGKKKKKRKKEDVSKSANPFWDGDGVQGKGQPRNNMGRWVKLPGSSALKKVGVWELDDGSFGVFHDGKQTPSKTFKTKRAAMLDAAKKVEADKPKRSATVEAGYDAGRAAFMRGEGLGAAKKEIRRGARTANREDAKYQAAQNRGKNLGGGLKVGSKVTLDPDKVKNKQFKGKQVEVLEVRGNKLVVMFPNGDRRLVNRDMVIIKKSVVPVEISDEEFDALVAEIDADELDTVDFSVEGEIEKRDDEQQMVFGWCSIAKHADGTVEVDKQGDVLEDIDQMEKVAYDFVLHSRDGGEMHVRKGVSTLVESFVSTPEKWEAMGIPEGTLPTGWWVGFKVIDSEVWKNVKNGKYKMFSVHGSGTRKALSDDA